MVILGRELLVTLFRSYVKWRRGLAISAGKSGKYKAFVQNLFSGAVLLWYPILMVALERGWEGGLWRLWRLVHGAIIGITLGVALVLTLFSMCVYFWRYRVLMGIRR